MYDFHVCWFFGLARFRHFNYRHLKQLSHKGEEAGAPHQDSPRYALMMAVKPICLSSAVPMDHNKEERADDGGQTSGDVAVHMRKVLTVGPRVGLESDFC